MVSGKADLNFKRRSEGNTAANKDIVSASLEPQIYFWNDNHSDGNSGLQYVMPYSISYTKNNINIGFRNAHVLSKFSSSAGSATVNSFTDSTLSFMYDLPKGPAASSLPANFQKAVDFRFPFSARFGLAFNLPTGASRLTNSELGAKMDQDLVMLPIFGEGFAVNPSINLSKNLGKITLGWGIGYNWKFAYDPTVNIDNDDVHPANILNTNLGIKIDFTKRFFATWDFIYSSSGQENKDKDPYSDQGERFEFQWGVSYDLNPLLLNADINYKFQNRNRIKDSSGNFILEDKNSNPDELIIDTEMAYHAKPFTGKFMMQHKYLTANNYTSDNARYDAGRYRLTFGPKIEYQVKQRGALSFAVRYLYLHDDEDARGPETFYSGFQLLFGGSMWF